MSTDLSVVIACFNEEAALPRLFREVARLEGLASGRKITLETVFVDDGSSDATRRLLEKGCDGREMRRVIVHGVNRGFGAAMRTGFAVAKGDVLVSWDADATYPVEDILLLNGRIEGVDVAGATPFGTGENRAKPFRILLSKIVAGLYALALRRAGRGITVHTCAFRAYRRAALFGVENESDDFLTAAELLARLLIRGARVVEVPSTLSARVDGRSKMRVFRMTLRHLGQIARIALRRPPFRPVPSELTGKGATVGSGPLRAWNEALNRDHPMRGIEENPNSVIRRIEERRRTEIVRLLDAGPNDRVLDLGAEEGAYATRFARSVAVDIDPAVLRKGGARHGRPSVAADVQMLPFASGSVPRVLLAETLEHVPDPEAALAEALRVATPDGRVAVSVPDDERLLLMKKAIATAGLGKVLGGLPPGLAPGHLHVFGRDHLVDLLASAGRILSFSRDPAALAFLAVLAPHREDPRLCAASRASSEPTANPQPPARS